MRPPFLYRVYVWAAALAVPFAARARLKRLRRADVPVVRAHEVLGNSSLQRPGGMLIWFHAASVGESLSILPLINAMGVALPDARFLITTTTPTSARLITERMPERATHQFAPLDSAGPVSRFLKRWRPDAAIFVESELWPQMLVRARDAGIPLALIGARMSSRSLRHWARVPATARYILGRFSLILAQNSNMASALKALAPDTTSVETAINLKSLAPVQPIDLAAHASLSRCIGARPTWVAASTHPGEETAALGAHAEVLKTHSDALLILAPRHPERRTQVADLIRDRGLTFTSRSTDSAPEAQVYLADTLGEMGLWYALAPVVFLGGSLEPHGGHNPYEVAQGGAAILSGPHISNFAETFAPLEATGAVQIVSDVGALGVALRTLFDDPKAMNAARAAATKFATDQAKGADALATRLIDTLGLVP